MLFILAIWNSLMAWMSAEIVGAMIAAIAVIYAAATVKSLSMMFLLCVW